MFLVPPIVVLGMFTSSTFNSTTVFYTVGCVLFTYTMSYQIKLQKRSHFTMNCLLWRGRNHAKEMQVMESEQYQMQMQIQMHTAEREHTAYKMTQLQLAKHKLDCEAFSTLNHAGKRTMLNSIFWVTVAHTTQCSISDCFLQANKLQKDVIPDLVSSTAQSDAAHAELTKITSQILNDNMHGVDMCRSVLLHQQVTAGTYQLRKDPCHLESMLTKQYGGRENLTISVDTSMPGECILSFILIIEL